MTSDPQAQAGDPGQDRDGRRERLKRMFGADDVPPTDRRPDHAAGGPPENPVPVEPDGSAWHDEQVPPPADGPAAGRSWQQPDPAVSDSGAWTTGSWARRPQPGPAANGHAEPVAASPSGTGREALLSAPDELRASWQQVQGIFVDDPHRAVQEAGVLVERTLDDIRSRVSDAGAVPSDASSTEELRMAFLRHREFFQRLLSA